MAVKVFVVTENALEDVLRQSQWHTAMPVDTSDCKMEHVLKSVHLVILRLVYNNLTY